jgi:hypothetical protein
MTGQPETLLLLDPDRKGPCPSPWVSENHSVAPPFELCPSLPDQVREAWVKPPGHTHLQLLLDQLLGTRGTRPPCSGSSDPLPRQSRPLWMLSLLLMGPHFGTTGEVINKFYMCGLYCSLSIHMKDGEAPPWSCRWRQEWEGKGAWTQTEDKGLELTSTNSRVSAQN